MSAAGLSSSFFERDLPFMCGRYALFGPRAFSRAEREYFEGIEAFAPTYNAAPTDLMPIARLKDGKPQLMAAKWGLVPYWAKDPKSGYRSINARAETCTSSPLFRSAYREKRRCLVPASGFYEWKQAPGGKQPYYITSADGSLLAFAGLWERWRMSNGETLVTYTVITGEPNQVVKPLHDRMPVVLAPHDYDKWLSGDDPRELLRPCAPELLVAFPVSARVNKPGNNDPQLVQAIDTVKGTDDS
ncbi:MAG: SOS response-associated peptidase [Burkholderiales bacterium]